MKNYQPFSLEGKNIIITGASSGIGRECAISCSKMEAKVILIGRDDARLTETITLMSGSGHQQYNFNVTQFEDIEALLQKITNSCGKISGFIHSAGIEITRPLNVMNTNVYDEIFKVNTIAAFEFSRVISKKKFANDSGLSIIFISSIISQCGQSGLIAYAASKSALTGGMKSLAIELAPKKIRVNTIEPGWIIGTQMTKKYEDEDNTKEKLYPLGYGQTEDVANACIYLLSDASRWITGTNLIVDGGYSAK